MNWEKLLLALNITRALLGVVVALMMILVIGNLLVTVDDGSIFEGISYTQSNHTTVELTTPDSLVMVSDNVVYSMGEGSNYALNTTAFFEEVRE